MEITVVIGTYGDAAKWWPLTMRAVRSAERAGADQIVAIHEKTLAEARNKGARGAAGDYLVFLDADDELDEGYIDAMKRSEESVSIRSDYRTFLHQPSTLGITNGRPDPAPSVIAAKPIESGNYMVIGTMVEKKMFDAVGGFKEWDAYEDWDLWWRCIKAGAGVTVAQEAVYRVHVNPKGRNAIKGREAWKIAADIRRANEGP